MKVKIVIGSAIAAALLGVGVMAGGVMGTGNVSAQTSPTAVPTAQATAVPGQEGVKPGDLGMGGRHGGRGGFEGGPGGFGRGGFGAATADGATQAIANATELITLIKSDLAFASGKMDTASVQKWLAGADTLLQDAQSANGSSQFGQAVAYAHAARELAMTARTAMAQELGANTLPSYSQLPQRGDKVLPSDASVTQVQASRILAETYNRIVSQNAIVKSASNASEAATYMTDAQNAYKTAYDAYQAGNYSDAVASARIAGQLSSVAGAVVRAPAAPANADTAVTVPAPNFP